MNSSKKMTIALVGALAFIVTASIGIHFYREARTQRKELPSNYGGKNALLVMEDTKIGADGPAVAVGNKILIHFIQKIDGGKELDNSYKRVPLSFLAGKGSVLSGLDQGVIGMKVGGKRHLVIPPDLAYGMNGNGSDIPANSTIVYDVELLKIER